MRTARAMGVLVILLGISAAQDWQTPTQTTTFQFTRFDGEYFPGTGKVYFMGGRLGAGTTDGTVWSYTPSTQTYANTGVTMPIPVSNYDICLLRDNYNLAAGDTYGLYIFGGRMGTGVNTDTVQVYYPRSNTARKLTTDRYPGLISGAVPSPLNAVVTPGTNYAWVFGGFNATAYLVSNLTYRFDPLAAAGSKWTALPNLGFARCYIAGAVIDDTLVYTMGGDTSLGSTTPLLAVNKCERLNTRNTAAGWVRVADIPEICGESRAFAFNVAPTLGFNRQIILAGQGQWPAESAKCFIYSVSSNSWASFATLDSARRNHAGAYIPGTTGTNGVPGMWVWGGRKVTDATPLITAEFYAVGLEVGCTRILAPTGTADSGGSVTPACSLYNYGAANASYAVRMKIGTAYNQTATVTNHAPGTTVYATFPAWTAAVRGWNMVSCSTELANDFNQTNNKRTDSVLVLVHDVASVSVTPTGTISPGSVTPTGTVRNNGTGREPVNVTLSIVTAAPPYSNTVALAQGLPVGVDTSVSFPAWNASSGTYTVRCSVYLATDQDRGNDVVSAPLSVVSTSVPGWHEKASMPVTPSGRAVKDGGWLVRDGDYIYAAKGNKTGDFYRYDPAADSWKTLASIPDGPDGKKPGKGAVGVSSDYIYAVKGNSTQEFWAYSIGLDSWYRKADIPLGFTNKKVKGGTDIVSVKVGQGQGSVDYLYLLKGYKNEFWRYNTELDSWTAMPNAPLGTSGKDKYDKGSWLVEKRLPQGGPRVIYAHKAKYHELFLYNTEGDSWMSVQLTGMPFIGMMGKSKKSKDGGSATSGGEGIYALKGGNTQEFWEYYTDGDSWKELDTMPALGSTGKKKKVKAGADIVSAGDEYYALKGNKTNELWQYVPYVLGARPYAARSTQASGVMRDASNAMRLAPNPLAGGFVTLQFSLATAGPAAVRVTDVTGRTVTSVRLAAARTGSTTLDVRGLADGLYLVRLTARGTAITSKLVVQH